MTPARIKELRELAKVALAFGRRTKKMDEAAATLIQEGIFPLFDKNHELNPKAKALGFKTK